MATAPTKRNKFTDSYVVNQRILTGKICLSVYY